MALTWSASTDDVELGGYVIYRDSSPIGFSASTTLAYTDTGLTAGTSYTYQVYAFDSSGIRSTVSNSATAATPPAVSVTAPTTGATVSGSAVSLTASVTSAGTVAGVQFKMDTNTFIGTEFSSGPYSLTWDTTTGVTDGTHTLIAVAHDPAGNYSTSTAIAVTVHNNPPVRSGGSPSGALTHTTTATTLSLTTSLAATCKYSATAGLAYDSDSMTAFTTTGGTSHSQSITGLTAGGTYNYYVKCHDTFGLTNSDDYTISFSVSTTAVLGDVPAYGLVGHWQFDTSTGTTTDSSSNGYTATMHNGPTVVTGIAGDALNFATTSTSNNNYVSFPAAVQGANFPQSGSLSFWIKGVFSTQASSRTIFPSTGSANSFYVNTYTSGRLQINLVDPSNNYLGPNRQVIHTASGSYSNFPITDNT